MNALYEERNCTALDLQKILQSNQPGRAQMLADMFAMGCILHFQGERIAGSSLIKQVFETVKGSIEICYLESVLDAISGNELRFAREVEPSAELMKLCDRALQGPRKEAACAR